MGYLAWTLADVQMNYGGSSAYVQWFSAEMLEQLIVMSLYDITMFSHDREEGNYKRRA